MFNLLILKLKYTFTLLYYFQDLFFKYTWNNFLHTQVQQCLALAINCDYQDNNIYGNVGNMPLTVTIFILFL